jgi:hypothetical protein
MWFRKSFMAAANDLVMTVAGSARPVVSSAAHLLPTLTLLLTTGSLPLPSRTVSG